MMTSVHRVALPTIVVSACATALFAAVPSESVRLHGTDPAVAARLDEADRQSGKARFLHAAAGCLRLAGLTSLGSLPAADGFSEAACRQWDVALLEYLRLLDGSGNALVAVGPGRYIPVRHAIRERLAELPHEVLRVYRRLIDQRARQVLEKGQAVRDHRVLLRAIDETPLSSFESAALDQIGDLRFARGALAEAVSSWQRAAAIPDTSVDKARLEAKRLLALWFQGEERACAEGLLDFARRHGHAAGQLAGRSGPYLDTLRAVIRKEQPPQRHSASFATVPNLCWRAENRRAGGVSPLFLPSKQGANAPRSPSHALILSDAVVFDDGISIRAYALDTGKLRWEHLRADDPERLALPAITLLDGRLYAVAAGAKSLICLDAETGRLLWQRTANGLPQLPWFEPGPRARFDGVPVIVDDQIITGVVSRDDEATIEVACFQAQTGARCWRQTVCKCRTGDATGAAQGLLARAGRFIIYNTPCGVVAALDPETGQIAWALDAGSPAKPRAAEPWPCWYANGRLYLVPAGERRLSCLDAETGRLVWRTAELDVDHLLGVAAGTLVLATGGDIRGLDAGSGAVKWRQPPEGQLASAGRGFIAGARVVWPAADGVRVLDLASGALAGDPAMWRRVPSGNLVWDGRHLAVAATDRLLLYGSDE